MLALKAPSSASGQQWDLRLWYSVPMQLPHCQLHSRWGLKPLPVQHLVWGWLPQWQPLSCRWGLSPRGLCPGHSVLRGRRVRDRQQPYGPAAADRAQIHLVLSALLSLHLGLQTRLQELPQQQPCARLYPCPAALLSLCRDLCPWLHLLCLCTNIRVSCKTDSTVYCRPV